MFNNRMINAIIVALEFRERALASNPNAAGLAATREALATMRALQRDEAIVSAWDIADVHHMTEDSDGEFTLQLTDADARAVLAEVAQSFDATIGINWDVLGDCLNIVLARREETA